MEKQSNKNQYRHSDEFSQCENKRLIDFFELLLQWDIEDKSNAAKS
jgi:hypothetical protein